MATTNKEQFEPVEVTVRHGLFWFFSREPQVVVNNDTGLLEEKPTLVQRTATQNDVITLVLQSDYQRGLDHHAFWTEDELKHGASIVQAPHPGSPAGELPRPAIETGEAGHSPDGGGTEPVDPTEVNVEELDTDDLGDWLTGTGMFDGSRKPNQDETIAKVGDNAELAERVLAADKIANGGTNRQKVEAELNKVIEKATA